MLVFNVFIQQLYMLFVFRDCILDLILFNSKRVGKCGRVIDIQEVVDVFVIFYLGMFIFLKGKDGR